MGRPTNSRKVDVWALGCLFYELLTHGVALFPGKNECLRPSLVGRSHMAASLLPVSGTWHQDASFCSMIQQLWDE